MLGRTRFVSRTSPRELRRDLSCQVRWCEDAGARAKAKDPASKRLVDADLER